MQIPECCSLDSDGGWRLLPRHWGAQEAPRWHHRLCQGYTRLKSIEIRHILNIWLLINALWKIIFSDFMIIFEKICGPYEMLTRWYILLIVRSTIIIMVVGSHFLHFSIVFLQPTYSTKTAWHLSRVVIVYSNYEYCLLAGRGAGGEVASIRGPWMKTDLTLSGKVGSNVLLNSLNPCTQPATTTAMRPKSDITP